MSEMISLLSLISFFLCYHPKQKQITTFRWIFCLINFLMYYAWRVEVPYKILTILNCNALIVLPTIPGLLKKRLTYISQKIPTISQILSLQRTRRHDVITIPAQILRQSSLEQHFAPKSTFWAKFLIITVISGSSLNSTAPKKKLRMAPFYLHQ